MSGIRLGPYAAALPARAPLSSTGRLVAQTGLVLRVTVAGVRRGEVVEIRSPGREPLAGEVIGLRGEEAVVLPLGPTDGLAAGAEVVGTGRPLSIRAGEALLGRVLDGLGRPIDEAPLPPGLEAWPVDRAPPRPLERRPIQKPFQLGVRALDGLLTVGEGQRIGLFAGAGVGKSTLLGQIVRGAAAEVNVVGLVGERGREVQEFLATTLGPAGRARSVVVAATSDEPALLRLRSAQVATSLAEWFAAARGRRVLLVLDSLTRFARAQREVGLAAGEPPVRQGYPPSVFAELPRLVERAGVGPGGAITAVYTVLVAGGDLEEPVADEIRGLLDGHVVLDGALAERGHHPAIDVLRSVSRAMPAVVGARHLALAARARSLLATWERQRDLVALGAYAPGSDPATDEARARIPALEALLRQAPGEVSSLAEAVAGLEAALG